MLLHVRGVHHESVRGLALAVDGNISRIHIARGIDGAGDARHDDRSRCQVVTGADARLNRQQIRVAAAVQWLRRDLRAGHHFAELGGRRFDLRLEVGSVLNYSDFFRLLADLQHRIKPDRRIRVDGQVVFLLGPESRRIYREIILADRQGGKDVGALASDVALNSVLSALLTMVNLAPGIIAPLWSLMVPERVPPDTAHTRCADKRANPVAAKSQRNLLEAWDENGAMDMGETEKLSLR